MRIKGKITKYEKEQFCMPLGEAEIELPSVDVSKIKPLDKVWIEYEVYLSGDCTPSIYFKSVHTRLMDDVVAHFPASPAPKPNEYCECNPKDRILCLAMECGYCHKCNKLIPPKVEYCTCFNKDSDGEGGCRNCGKKIDFSVKPYPAPGEIEEFQPIDFLGIPGSKEIAQCMIKLNQLIRAGRGK